MALIKSSIKLIIKEFLKYEYQDPVLTLGIPEIYATPQEIKQWFVEFTKSESMLESNQMIGSGNEIGKKFGWITAGTFFKSLGLGNVESIDIPGCEYIPDHFHDLNYPLPENFINHYNFILDPGTLEHVFDIKTCLENIMRSLKVGGVVIHQVPIYSYNGGYYSINPNVLNDFYLNNGFSDLSTYIIMWDRYHAYTGKNRCYVYNENLLGPRHSLADYDQCRFSPHILFFARKIREEEKIKIPLQYEGQYVLSLPPKRENFVNNRLKKFFKVFYHLLPFTFTFYIRANISRISDLLRTRRNSFWI